MVKDRHEHRLVTVDEVADRLCVQPRTVRDWARSGVLPSVRVGAGTKPRVRFDNAAIEDYLRERSS